MFQGYAARGKFLQFVPFCAIRTFLLLATQIPQSGMRTSLSLCEREFVPFGYDIKGKTPHKVVLKLCANRIQGYAARGKFLQFVPFCAIITFLLLATQIPQSGMRTSLSQSEREFVPFGYDIKEKNTTQGGVFPFMVHLQGFEPGTH